MTTFEKHFRAYAAKHPEATVEETTRNAELNAEFEETFKRLDPASQRFIHDLIAMMVTGRKTEEETQTASA